MVAADEDAVAEKGDVAVRVTRGRVDLPAVDQVAGPDRLRVLRKADERCEDVPALEQIAEHCIRDAVAGEPLRDALRPVV